MFTMSKIKNMKGLAAVEFALVLPMLLLVLFGIIEFAVIFYDKAVVTEAARVAARAGIVLSSPKLALTSSTTCGNGNDSVACVAINYCRNNLISFASGSTPLATSIPINPSGNSFGKPLTVPVSFVFGDGGLGTILNIMTGSSKSITLSATSVMNHE